MTFGVLATNDIIIIIIKKTNAQSAYGNKNHFNIF